MACGVVSNAGLRLGASPVDGLLAGIDGLVGIDVAQVVRAFAAQPATIDALAVIYNASGAIAVALIGLRLLANRRAEAWELVMTIVLAMQVVALVSIVAPAVGAMAHLAMLDLQGAGLPAGAGIYHLEAFHHFRAGTDTVLRLDDMSGLVTFPSFHTVLALVALQAVARTRLRWLGVAWAAAVIVSTIPIGGHYVIDLVAGFAIWAGAVTVARRVSTPSA
nr:phosphatase PAP2 family protein [Tsuneonella aeria]